MRIGAASELPGFPATNVVDGTPAHWNAADAAPGWIELTLETPAQVQEIALLIAQDPAGPLIGTPGR